MRKVPESTALLGLSVVTGLLCGLAAVALKVSIHAIQGWLSGIMPGSRLPYLVLPGVGMLLSLLIVKFLVRDNIGHGVTKVLQAAGGCKPFADKTRIRVTRCDKDGKQTVTYVDLIEMGEKGRPDKDMILKAGDVVWVPMSWY